MMGYALLHPPAQAAHGGRFTLLSPATSALAVAPSLASVSSGGSQPVLPHSPVCERSYGKLSFPEIDFISFRRVLLAGFFRIFPREVAGSEWIALLCRLLESEAMSKKSNGKKTEKYDVAAC
jgi:hypothetical protein